MSADNRTKNFVKKNINRDLSSDLAHKNFVKKNINKKDEKSTSSGGSLGSWVDEERS